MRRTPNIDSTAALNRGPATTLRRIRMQRAGVVWRRLRIESTRMIGRSSAVSADGVAARASKVTLLNHPRTPKFCQIGRYTSDVGGRAELRGAHISHHANHTTVARRREQDLPDGVASWKLLSGKDFRDHDDQLGSGRDRRGDRAAPRPAPGPSLPQNPSRHHVHVHHRHQARIAERSDARRRAVREAARGLPCRQRGRETGRRHAGRLLHRSSSRSSKPRRAAALGYRDAGRFTCSAQRVAGIEALVGRDEARKRSQQQSRRHQQHHRQRNSAMASTFSHRRCGDVWAVSLTPRSADSTCAMTQAERAPADSTPTTRCCQA